jgi:hypothetical protein
LIYYEQAEMQRTNLTKKPPEGGLASLENITAWYPDPNAPLFFRFLPVTCQTR